MSDKFVEKNFLYLLLLSLLIHAAVFVLLLKMPKDKAVSPPEPLMVDLDGIPEFVPPRLSAPPVERKAEARQRFEKEIAPKGADFREKTAPLPESQNRSSVPASEPAAPARSSAAELFRKKREQRVPETADLYPGAAKMAKLEESYRKKYGSEVAEGETRFLNTDDIQFGSFLRRFENSIYGVWRYPAEAARMGIEGITPVKITFNRRGEIVGRELLQSSGSKILDAEVLRTLDQVGPIGGFPRGYEKETFNLIAFFHYGITQGASRSLR
jgi:protein TonB